MGKVDNRRPFISSPVRYFLAGCTAQCEPKKDSSRRSVSSIVAATQNETKDAPIYKAATEIAFENSLNPRKTLHVTGETAKVAPYGPPRMCQANRVCLTDSRPTGTREATCVRASFHRSLVQVFQCSMTKGQSKARSSGSD